jgi:hypothetical protein
VRTRHGCFTLRRARLCDSRGEEVHLACPLISTPLRGRALFWATRLSFGEVARLLEEMCGLPLLSEDGVWRLVQRQAHVLDAAQHQAILDGAALPEPEYVAAEAAALYAAEAAEFVVLTDGIGVKAQKPTRQPANQAKQCKEEKRHDTDVLILPRPDGTEQILCEGLSEHWSLVEAARAFLQQEWSGATLPVVALSDGAKKIRADLRALFGEIGQGVHIILDWYHLEKRVYEQLSMAAHSREERESWQQQTLGLLWRGEVKAAQEFLASLCVRNRKAHLDLLGYLEKHASEIINYERRKDAGKPIGSGRMEKCVDQVVGYRQKGKGMSWTKKGSRALALLKVAELNAQSVHAARLPLSL